METPYLIVGLGNPGRHYARTRHNAGFMVLDRLARSWRVEWRSDKKFQAHVARTERDGRKIILCQPDTFMNASGEAVAALANFQKIPPRHVLVVVDDADLLLGQLRLRPDGRSGGHHGLESIESHLGTREYARQRIGIGRQEPGTAATPGQVHREISGYVLSPFRAEEKELLEKVLQKACDQIECWLAEGAAKAMNRHNGAVKVES
jgi:PTH1 family peptidyl-tRNA hydrolase